MTRRVCASVALTLLLAFASCGGDEAGDRDAQPSAPATTPVKEGGAARPATAEEERFAVAFGQALAEDVRKHGPAKRLVRAVIRWIDPADPLAFTVHVLAAEDRAQVPPRDAWYPLEWPNVDDELKRTDRLGSHAGVRREGRSLANRYEKDPAMQGDVQGWGEGPSPSPAVIETVRHLPDALRAAGVELDDEFAVSAAHFEGYGALAVLKATAYPGTIAALDARGELPEY